MHQSNSTCIIRLSEVSNSLVRRAARTLYKLKHWAERGHGLAGGLQLVTFIQLQRAALKQVDSDSLHFQLLQMVCDSEAATATKLVQEHGKPALE